jgi:hypothetical protein
MAASGDRSSQYLNSLFHLGKTATHRRMRKGILLMNQAQHFPGGPTIEVPRGLENRLGGEFFRVARHSLSFGLQAQ